MPARLGDLFVGLVCGSCCLELPGCLWLSARRVADVRASGRRLETCGARSGPIALSLVRGNEAPTDNGGSHDEPLPRIVHPGPAGLGSGSGQACPDQGQGRLTSRSSPGAARGRARAGGRGGGGRLARPSRRSRNDDHDGGGADVDQRVNGQPLDQQHQAADRGDLRLLTSIHRTSSFALLIHSQTVSAADDHGSR
jgi:hypothetical protein